MTEQLVRTEVGDGVCTIVLADVDGRNVLSRALVAELTAALDRADTDDDIRVVVLTNDGSVFCAGADLKERSDNPAQGGGSDFTAARPHELFARFAQSPKPYVGRIAGHCVAGGMGLAAAMDIAIADEDVKMGFTEVRVGVTPAIVSVLCLPRMRRADAADAFLRGRRFPASEAAAMGLINQAVPRHRLDAEVDQVVNDLLASAPGAIAATKQLLREVPALVAGGEADAGRSAAFDWAATLSGRLFAGAEAAQGMAAFKQKRTAPWVPDQPWDSAGVYREPLNSDPQNSDPAAGAEG